MSTTHVAQIVYGVEIKELTPDEIKEVEDEYNELIHDGLVGVVVQQVYSGCHDTLDFLHLSLPYKLPLFILSKNPTYYLQNWSY